ncbi:MAG: metallophosphoesterase family protein [Christensenellales bacterium]|jgi:exonuclease SbcD
MGFSFVHCADLHLGRKPDGSEERFFDFGAAFMEIAKYAVENDADCLLVAGDFFDKRSINAETLELALETLKYLKLENLPVIAIEGNHDRSNFREGRSWLEYLDGAGYIKLLKPKGEALELISHGQYGGCVTDIKGYKIIGLGYPGALTRQRLIELSELEKDKFILMLHAGVERFVDQDDSGIRLREFDDLKDNIIYAALGHIHSRQETAGFLYNPGAPENVDIDEGRYAEKGFYHVKIDDMGNVDVRHMQSKRRPVYFISVDVGKCEDADGIYNAAKEAADAEGIGEGAVVELRLYGKTDMDTAVVDRRRVEDVLYALGCVQVKVVDELNMLFGDAPDMFERNVIEEGIIGALAEEMGLAARGADIAQDIIDIKQMLLDQAEPADIEMAIEALRMGGDR